MFLRSFLSCSQALMKPMTPAPVMNLITTPQRSIVYRYVRKRSPFDKTNYIDNYVAPPVKYHKSRKPRLPHWDDPNVEWPPIMPRPTQLQGKQLIHSLEKKERLIKTTLRPFRVTDIRAGDHVEIKYLFSLSESLGNILTGVVVGRKNRNSYNSSFRVVMRVAGEHVVMDFKELSPLLAGIRVLNRGSGNLRSKLYHLAKKELSKDQYNKAIVKRIIKKRLEDGTKKKGKKSVIKTMRYDNREDAII